MAPKRKAPAEASDDSAGGDGPPVDAALVADPPKKARGRPKKAAVSKEAGESGEGGGSPATSPNKKADKPTSKESPSKKKAPVSKQKKDDGEAEGGGGTSDAANEKKPKKEKAAPAEKEVLAKTPLQRKAAAAGGGKGFKVVSWNLTTLRSMVDKTPDKLAKLVSSESPDLIVFQETKVNEADEAPYEAKLKALLPGYSCYFSTCTAKKSYAGTLALVKGGGAGGGGQKTLTAMFSNSKAKKGGDGGVKPIEVTFGLPTLTEKDGAVAKEVLAEGRIMTLEYEGFYVVATYVPNSGDKLQRLDFRTKVWDVKLLEYLKLLQAKKPVVWTGDLNVAHLDGDIWNCGAKHLAKSAGTTAEERQSFTDMLQGGNMVDAFRKLHGEDAKNWYTYWSVRAGNMPWNRGLRLDYFVCSQGLFESGAKVSVSDCCVLSGEMEAKEDDFVGIDHCAIALTLSL